MKIRAGIKKFNTPNLALVGILLGVSYWIIDPLIDAQLLSDGTFWNNTFNPDSKEIWLRCFISFLFLSFGIFAEFISSKRKQSEKTLKDSEEKFRLLYEEAPLGYHSLNENGHILKVNRAWLNLIGYTEDEVTGRWFGDFLDEDSKAKFRNRFPIFKAQGEAHRSDFIMIKKDGSPLPVSFEGRISCNEQGEFKQTHCIMRDETEWVQAEEILRRNEARFRELAELLPETVIETDREGNLTFINCHALNKFKYSAEDFQKGLNIFQFIVPEDKERAVQNFQKLLKGERGENNEYTALRKDGTSIQIEVLSAPIMQDGKPVGVRGIIADVTERKNAEVALRLNEERFRTIANFAYGWEDWLSPSGSLLWTNPSVERITGYSAKDCLSMPDYPLPLIIEEDREQAMAVFAQAVEGNWIDNFTFRVRRKDGQVIWMAVVTQPVFDSEGRHLGTRASLRDISKQKEAEEAVRKSEENYRTLMEQASDGIFVTDMAGNYIDINDSGCTMLGYTREEVLGSNIANIVSPEGLERLLPCGFHELEINKPVISEVLLKRKNGQPLEVEISAKKLTDGRFQGIFRDITERKKAEKDLRENKERYQNLYNNAYAGIFRTRLSDGMIFECNDYTAQMLGYENRLQLINIHSTAKFWAESGGRRAFIDELNSKGEVNNLECKIERGNETHLWGSITAQVCREEGYIEGVIVDITQRKKMEEALLESEAKFRTLFEYSVDGIFLMTDIFLDCNEQACKMWACEREDIVGHSPVEFSPEFQPDGRSSTESAKEKIDDALSGIPQRFYWKHLRKDGTLIDTEVALKAIIVNDLKILQATVRDITEKMKGEKALRGSEERFRKIFENSPIGIVMSDRDFRFTRANEAFCGMLGYSDNELISLTFRDITHPEHLHQDEENIKRLSRGEIPVYRTEKRYLRKDSKTVWGAVTISVLRDNDGQTICYLGTIEDITERKEAEVRLELSHSLLAATLESTADGILVVNLKGEIESFNRKFLQLWSMPEDIIALRDDNKALEYVLSQLKYPQQFLNGVKSLYATPEAESFDILEFKDGRYFERFSLPQKIGNDIVGRVWSFRDVTDKRRAQEAFSEEKERLAVTLRSIGDGVITTDTDGFVTLLNSVAERLTGWTRDEAVGKKLEQVFKIISNMTREIVSNPVERALQFGGPIELDDNTVLLTRDGSERMIADSAAPIKDERGHAIGVVLVFRDITEKLKIEEELAKTEKLESLGILAGGIAHDFNNILTAIMGNISLAKMNLPEDAEVSAILTSAEDASARAQDLTHQLLTFARGGVPIMKTASIIPVIKEAASLALRGSNARCNFSIDDNLFPVEFDETQLSRVIGNLVINGYQAMPEGGVINISAANIDASLLDHPVLKEGNWVKITVKDQGTGILPQYIDKIFDPFFTTKEKGSGLGLAISYSIIKRHGGHIEVESNDGTGSSLHVYLPASRQKIEESRNEDERLTPGVGKILIMDDDEGVRSVVCIALSKLGYQVTTARDGREAVESYKNAKESGQPFEAVIMDLDIPCGLGGKESIAILRQYDPNVKAIVSSGYNDDPIMAEYRKFGFCGAVCKPFNVQQLGSALHESLGKAGSTISSS